MFDKTRDGKSGKSQDLRCALPGVSWAQAPNPDNRIWGESSLHQTRGAPDGPAEHIPDVLAVASGGVWLIDVRPAGRIGEADRVKFAASAEAALACGWRYLLVAGWRPHVMATLDALSSQRRRLADPLGLQEVLLGKVSRGPRSFGDLVAGTIAPPVARAQLLHLLWHRRLSIDLGRPLADATLVHPADGRPG